MKDTLSTINEKVRASSNGKMAESTTASGVMANNTEEANLYLIMCDV